MPIIASNARFASSPPAAIASVSTRGVICQETPHLSLHQPHALSWPPLIADDGVPVAVSLFLIVSGDLEREGFVMLERGPAIEAKTGDAGDGEFDRQHVARLAGRIVAGSTVDGTHRAVRKGLGVEAGCSLGVLVVP